MDRLSDGFYEALENELSHAVAGLNLHTTSKGLDSVDKSLAPLNDFHAVIKAHSQAQPMIPEGGFHVSRSRPPQRSADAQLRRGSLMDESVGGSIRSENPTPSAVATAAAKQALAAKKMAEMRSYMTESWSMSKGWKHRPRRGKSFGGKIKTEDINRFAQRITEARARGDHIRGFRFGYHRNTEGSPAMRRHSLPEFGDRSSSVVQHSTSGSLVKSESLLGTQGAQKIRTIHKLFNVDKSLLLGEKYHPGDDQSILRDIGRGVEVSKRLSPQGRPILLPRAGSPLEKARTITFGSCRRFSYDPAVTPASTFRVVL